MRQRKGHPSDMWRVVATVIGVVLYMMPFYASSQAWLSGREDREGAGVKVGDSLIFHPGIALEGGYDTNPLRQDKNPEGAGRLRLTSYLDLATRKSERRVEDNNVEGATPPKIEFRFGLAGFYDFFFSKEDAVDKQDDFGIDTHLNFVLFPQGDYSFLSKLLYVRTLQPYESPEEWHARHTINPQLGFRARPGGGTLSLTLGYSADFLLYEDDKIADLNNKVTNDLRFDTAWKLLPKTALVTSIRFSPIRYLGSSSENVESRPIRSQVGIRGLLTERFGLTIMVGYGASFYSQGDDFDGLIAAGEIMFFPTPFSNIRLGGQRDFQDSFYANFYVKSGGYLKYEQMFGKIFLASIEGNIYHRDYSTLSNYPMSSVNSVNQGKRADIWVGAKLLLELRATNWLSVMASVAYGANFSEFAYNLPRPQPDDPVKFQKFEAMGGVRVHY